MYIVSNPLILNQRIFSKNKKIKNIATPKNKSKIKNTITNIWGDPIRNRVRIQFGGVSLGYKNFCC